MPSTITTFRALSLFWWSSRHQLRETQGCNVQHTFRLLQQQDTTKVHKKRFMWWELIRFYDWSHYLGCLMPPVFPRAAKCSSSISSFSVIGCWSRSNSTEILGVWKFHPLSSVSSPRCTGFNLLACSGVVGPLFFLFFELHVVASAAGSSIVKFALKH